MQAIEFTAQAKDGIIHIPQEYLEDIHGELRVINGVRLCERSMLI